ASIACATHSLSVLLSTSTRIRGLPASTAWNPSRVVVTRRSRSEPRPRSRAESSYTAHVDRWHHSPWLAAPVRLERVYPWVSTRYTVRTASRFISSTQRGDVVEMRLLRSSPLLSFVAIVSCAFGIGANATNFSIIGQPSASPTAGARRRSAGVRDVAPDSTG